MAPRKPKELTPAKWLQANGVDTAPLTGTDHRCVIAVAALWDIFAGTPSIHVLAAIRSTLFVMQPSTRDLTKQLIARSMDWSDIDKLWPRVLVVGRACWEVDE